MVGALPDSIIEEYRMMMMVMFSLDTSHIHSSCSLADQDNVCACFKLSPILDPTIEAHLKES